MRTCGIRVGPESNDWSPYEKRGHRDTEEDDVKMKAEIGALLPEAL